jgi:hypothetical protein
LPIPTNGKVIHYRRNPSFKILLMTNILDGRLRVYSSLTMEFRKRSIELHAVFNICQLGHGEFKNVTWQTLNALVSEFDTLDSFACHLEVIARTSYIQECTVFGETLAVSYRYPETA